jgi:hypothetical protein
MVMVGVCVCAAPQAAECVEGKARDSPTARGVPPASLTSCFGQTKGAALEPVFVLHAAAARGCPGCGARLGARDSATAPSCYKPSPLEVGSRRISRRQPATARQPLPPIALHVIRLRLPSTLPRMRQLAARRDCHTTTQ